MERIVQFIINTRLLKI